MNHRIIKFDPTLERALMQIGVTGEPGNDATRLNSPSGILFTREGNIVVTDGYGNNRVVLYGPDGTFIKQVGRGRGGPDDKGAGPGEWDLPHQGAVDADDNLYLVDRENRRIQVFDNRLNYVREFANEGWNPWDIAISRRGDDGFAYIADHAGERVHKIALDDGRILATWGEPGRGPGQFDWVHGMAVDTQGAVYAADTYGPAGAEVRAGGAVAGEHARRDSPRAAAARHAARDRPDGAGRDSLRGCVPVAGRPSGRSRAPRYQAVVHPRAGRRPVRGARSARPARKGLLRVDRGDGRPVPGGVRPAPRPRAAPPLRGRTAVLLAPDRRAVADIFENISIALLAATYDGAPSSWTRVAATFTLLKSVLILAALARWSAARFGGCGTVRRRA